MKKKLSFFVVAMEMIILSGCSSDYYYANTFLRKFETGRKNTTEQIYVVLPREVIHTNSSLGSVHGFAYMNEREQDSVITSLTKILNCINDSIFLDQFNNAFLFTLSRTCIPVVVLSDASKMPIADDQHFTVNIVQLEAEEFVQHQRSDFQTKKGLYYAYDYDLRHFSVNTWLKLDACDTTSSVYFRNKEIEERFQGTVKSIKDGRATLKTNFELIDVNDAYKLARSLGAECATLYIEKILTEYVCRTKGTNDTYFYYDPRYNMIESVLPYDEGIKESFEVMSDL